MTVERPRLSFNTMNQIKKRREKYAQLQRKRHREELMIERRVWYEPPSPVFDIPVRIEKQIWQDFQIYLDSFGERELNLVDAHIKEYLYEEWLKLPSPEWNNESAVNIIRILFRLKISEKIHARAIVDLAFEARSVFQDSNDLHAGQVLLLLMKEISIHLEEGQENTSIWEGEIQQLLNQFISTLKIYQRLTTNQGSQFYQIFKDYRIYYILLLTNHRVNIQEFVRLCNVGELYYLIDDCINQTDSQEVQQLIELIKKMLRIQGNEEVEKCLNGVSVLLIEGIMQARDFLDNQPFHKEQKGRFFTQFLKKMTTATIQNINSGVELLAQLFSMFDECIPVALQVNLLPFMEEELIITSSKVTTYAAFIKFYLESISSQVRWNCFWLISNITGSDNYFRQYGLQFLTLIYQKSYLYQQRYFPQITNEITICVLNYVCNITLPEEIEQVFYIECESKQIQENQIQVFTPMPNCLLFCIDVACDIIEMIYVEVGNHCNVGEEKIDMFYRAVSSLLRILENAEKYMEMVVATLERQKVDVMLEHIHSKLAENTQKTNILDLITHFLDLLNTNIKQL